MCIRDRKEAILAYLQEGGDLILLTDPAQTGEERPNLEELMAEYGMSSAQGVVVEGDPSHYALGSPVSVSYTHLPGPPQRRGSGQRPH